jgi:hypothetical protein
MAEVCGCNTGPGNTGLVSCLEEIKDIKRGILVPMKANDGTPNKYAVSTTFDLAFFTTQINEADSSKRWYPMPDLKNFSGTVADDNNETFEDGDIKFINSGNDTFEAISKNATPQMANAYNKMQCLDMGILPIDKDGKLVGDISEDGFIKPIRFSSSTFRAKYMYANGTATAHLMFAWAWHQNVCVDQIGYIGANDIANDVDILELNGLLDAIVVGTPVTTATTITVVLVTKFGSAASPLPVEGADNIADWSVVETSPTPGVVSITNVTESPAGTYVLSAITTSGDVADVNLTKDGYEMTTFVSTTP